MKTKPNQNGTANEDRAVIGTGTKVAAEDLDVAQFVIDVVGMRT